MMLKSGNKRVLLTVFIFFVLVGGSFALMTYNASPKNLKNTVPTLAPVKEPADVPQQTTLEGDIVCLPHRDISGPQTLECAIGLKAADGSYYALDAGGASPSPYNTGDRIRANGLMVPIEQISSDHWQKYNIKGIFSIKDGLEIL